MVKRNKLLADLIIDQSVSLLVLLQHDFPKLDAISSFWVWCNISKKHIFHFLSFISLKTTELFSKELSAQTTMQYTSGSHRGIVNYNVAVHQKMSLSLCSSPEGPWRSMYQRLERSLKCCWQNRQRALHLCQSFSFEWFKLSRAQQELILAQGGSQHTEEKIHSNMHVHVSLPHTWSVFLQLRFGGLKPWICTHFPSGDHSQVFSSDDLPQSCFLVHLWTEQMLKKEQVKKWIWAWLYKVVILSWCFLSHTELVYHKCAQINRWRWLAPTQPLF